MVPASEQQLNDWFTSGVLVRPDATQPNFVDLVNALASIAGAKDEGAAGAQTLVELIEPTEHVVFLLVDGLGESILELLPEGAFLRKHRRAGLQAVFLSTTACALTTLATGAWPAQHGMPGWWTYLGPRDMSIVSLPFAERFSTAALQMLDVSMEEVYPLPALWQNTTRAMTSVLPRNIVDSAYSAYASGTSRRVAYYNMADALDKTEGVLQSVSGPSFTYVYLPQVDAHAHTYGAVSEEAEACLVALNGLIQDFAANMAGRARIVISADHGLVTVKDDARCVLEHDDPMLAMLHAWPTGEPAVPMFHVKAGQEEAFHAACTNRFGERFCLVTPAVIEEMRLLGPGPLSPLMKERLGTFIGIAPRPTELVVRHANGSLAAHRGVHGGLRAAEMGIPLVVV